ncbi:serine/threonine-protein kinase [Kitasatospora sp. NPDC097643]|uniref:serine/threonine-protein kinase n=1 Tax=Kitasatospora sp. NPDC097643 TaxID=3157230 RepID=UPI0033340C4F
MRGGAMIAGRYRMVECIGSGGMGAVWKAHDTFLARDVAVKLIHPGLGGVADHEMQARFRREVLITAQLKHPNLVAVHDCGIHHDAGQPVPFVVVDLLVGQPLDVLLRSGRRPTLAEVVEWGVQTCHGLAVAHFLGIVHRDIKPGNLFLTRREDGTEGVVILDFGIATSLQGDHTQITQTGFNPGSPPYMAPEQARGERVDTSADLYALGCVLYALLTGEPPFGLQRQPLAFAMAHVSEPPVPPRRLRPDIPTALDRLVLQLLTKNPADRLGPALAVAEALRAVTADRLPGAEELTADYRRANGLSQEGRHGEAATLLERVAADRARVLGADHPDTLSARHNHGYNLGEAGRYREAAALLAQVAVDRARVLGPDDPHTLSARHNHAYNLGQSGERAQAALLLAQVAVDRARVLGPNHPHTLSARHNHAYNLGEAGQYAEAAVLLERVAADRARVLGTHHRQTVSSRRSHAVYAGRIGQFG